MKSLNLISLFIISIFIYSDGNAQTSDFFIEIRAETEHSQDYHNYIGVSTSATNGYDPGIDIPKPPQPAGDYIYLSIQPMVDSPPFYIGYSQDWRNAETDFEESCILWPIEVEAASENETITINFAIHNSTGTVIPVKVIYGEVTQDILSDSTLVLDANSTNMVIVVGNSNRPQVSMISPNSGDELNGSESTLCEWLISSDHLVLNTLLTVSYNNGVDWTTLLDEDTLCESFLWSVPETNIANGRLKVKVVDELYQKDSTEVSFSVVYETNNITDVSLFFPQDNDYLSGGDTITAIWSYSGGDQGLDNTQLSWALNGSAYSELNSFSNLDTSWTFRIPDSLFSPNTSFLVTTLLTSGNTFTDSASSVSLCATYLCNSDFEIWDTNSPDVGPPDNWSIGGGAANGVSVLRSYTYQVEGFCSANKNINSSGSYSLYQTISGPLIQEGIVYEFKGKILDNDPRVEAKLRMSYLNNDGGVISISESETSVDDSEFLTYSAIGIVPEGAEFLRFEICADGETDGSIYVDYLQISIPESYITVSILEPTGGEEFTYNGINVLPTSWSYGNSHPYVSSCEISYSINGGNNWNLITQFNNNTSVQYDWQGVDDYSIQTLIKITANPYEENVNSDVSEIFSIRPSMRIDTLEAGWHLYGLQLFPSDTTADAIIGDDVSSAYYLYDYVDTLGYHTVDRMSNLEGYWLALDDASMIDIEGEASFSPLSRTIYSGWNLISCGFPKEVKKSDLKFKINSSTKLYGSAVSSGWISAEIYGYDFETGQYLPVGENGYLLAGKGYWLGVLADSLEFIVEPPVVTAENPDDNPHDPQPSRDFWSSDIIAIIDGNRVHDLLTVGVNSNASDGFDCMYDCPSPPDSPTEVRPRLKLVSQSGPTPLGHHLLRDIRGRMDEENREKIWRFAIEKGETSTLHLDFSRLIEKMPVGYWASFHKNGIVYDLHQSAIITISENDEIYPQLFVEYGTDPVNEIPSDLLPNEYAVTSIYPNPFNDQVKIRISLPYRDLCDLCVFNIHGQLVQRLNNSYLPAGYHDFSWIGNGTSGIYFVRFNSGAGFSSTRKIMYVK